MPRNFDDLLSSDRTFTVRGETFTFLDVSPDVLSAFTPETNGKAEPSVWKVMDQQICLFLSESDRERWTELRAREENPVTIKQVTEVLKWLMEEQTGLPTEQPSPSAPGRGRTAGSSRAA